MLIFCINFPIRNYKKLKNKIRNFNFIIRFTRLFKGIKRY